MTEGFPTPGTPAAAPGTPAAPAGVPSQEPLGVEVEETGHPGVDAVLAHLEALEGTPTDAHVAVYEDVHQRLRDTLTALDERPGPTPGP